MCRPAGWRSRSAFAGYSILRPLGSGGMADVYLAKHPRLPRRDALKVLTKGMTADDEFRERFNREADLAATLFHPHIVAVHDRGEFEGQLWIAMDYVEGTDAARLVKERYRKGMSEHDVGAIVDGCRGCTRLRPCARTAAPRRETRQHPAHPSRGRRTTDPVGGFRSCSSTRRYQRNHRDQRRGGNGCLRRPRTVGRVKHRRAGRPVRAGRHRISLAYRCAAISAFQPGRRDRPASARGSAQAQRPPSRSGAPR